MLARAIIILLFIATLAGAWDIWWHGAIGRDTPWEPPHLLLYAATTAAIVTGLFGWYRHRQKIWRRLALILLLVPLAAPFDEIWHRFFGPETPASVLIIWSPPHLLLTGALFFSFLMLLSHFRKEPDLVSRQVLGAAAFGSMLNLLLFVYSPLDPTGPYHLFGFWGAGVAAFLIIAIMITAQDWLPGFAGATLTTLFVLLIVATNFQTESLVIETGVQPHDHAPGWLITFSYLLMAFVLDWLERKPSWFRGALAGGLWAGTLYGFAYMFFEPQFVYSTSESLIAILMGFGGGWAAGFFLPKVVKL